MCVGGGWAAAASRLLLCLFFCCCLRSACGLCEPWAGCPWLRAYIAPRHTRCHFYPQSHRSRWAYALIGKVLDHVVPCQRSTGLTPNTKARVWASRGRPAPVEHCVVCKYSMYLGMYVCMYCTYVGRIGLFRVCFACLPVPACLPYNERGARVCTSGI